MNKVLIMLMVLILISFSVPVSTAASIEEFTFILPGDINSDNLVDVNDVTAMQKYIAYITSDNETDLITLDFNGDGKVNIYDATEIQRKIANMDYSCFMYPENNYVYNESIDSDEKTPLNGKIEYEKIIEQRDIEKKL